MRAFAFGILVILSFVMTYEQVAHATLPKHRRDSCCRRCKKPPKTCVCLAPPVTQSAMMPVYETRYRQEQYVNHKEVCETHYRSETFQETVPVTTTKQVMVDEGCYKMVWVPKMVCKEVPETTYVNRLNCRVVPYEVKRSLPEVCTKWVPYQALKYVPTTCVPGRDGVITGPAISPATPEYVPTYERAIEQEGPAIEPVPEPMDPSTYRNRSNIGYRGPVLEAPVPEPTDLPARPAHLRRTTPVSKQSSIPRRSIPSAAFVRSGR